MTKTAAALLVVVGLTACARSDSSVQALAALDSAYKAGVLSREEYETKRVALVNQSRALATLDKARDAGILTQDEYRAKKLALLPAVPTAAPTQAPVAVQAENAITAPAPAIDRSVPVAAAPAQAAAREPTHRSGGHYGFGARTCVANENDQGRRCPRL
jgi:Short C-terminal domain